MHSIQFCLHYLNAYKQQSEIIDDRSEGPGKSPSLNFGFFLMKSMTDVWVMCWLPQLRDTGHVCMYYIQLILLRDVRSDRTSLEGDCMYGWCEKNKVWAGGGDLMVVGMSIDHKSIYCMLPQAVIWSLYIMLLQGNTLQYNNKKLYSTVPSHTGHSVLRWYKDTDKQKGEWGTWN